jgi:ABC-2 type transport system permease protein
MFVVQLVTGYTVMLGPGLLLIIPALFVATLLSVGVAFLVSALNVRYRDTQHITEVLLTAGFWLNPIVYPIVLVVNELGPVGAKLYWLNPMAGVTVAMQRALYAADVTITGTTEKVLPSDGYLFYLERLGVGALVSLIIFVLGVRVFRRMSADFAENL